jgi:hypothetical protein
MYICPYLGGGTFVTRKTIASKARLASHLFVYCIESLNVVNYLSDYFILGQESRSASWLASAILPLAKKVQRAHLHISHKINATSRVTIVYVRLS